MVSTCAVGVLAAGLLVGGTGPAATAPGMENAGAERPIQARKAPVRATLKFKNARIDGGSKAVLTYKVKQRPQGKTLLKTRDRSVGKGPWVKVRKLPNRAKGKVTVKTPKIGVWEYRIFVGKQKSKGAKLYAYGNVPVNAITATWEVTGTASIDGIPFTYHYSTHQGYGDELTFGQWRNSPAASSCRWGDFRVAHGEQSLADWAPTVRVATSTGANQTAVVNYNQVVALPRLQLGHRPWTISMKKDYSGTVYVYGMLSCYTADGAR